MLRFGQALRDAVATCSRLPSRTTPSLIRTYATRKRKTQSVPSVLKELTVVQSSIKTYKPITPGIRHLRRPISPHLYKGRPLRLLTIAKRGTGGRNTHGKITARSRGGGHKRRIRLVDFKREEPGPQDVIRIEYDPGRSAHIALIKSRIVNSRQPYSYILAPEGLRAGDVVESYRLGIPENYVPGFKDAPYPTNRERRLARLAQEEQTAAASKKPRPSTLDPRKPELAQAQTQVTPAEENETEDPLSGLDMVALEAAARQAESQLTLGVLRTKTVKTGNVLPLRLIPVGTLIHNVCLSLNGSAVLVRSAGTYGQVVDHDAKGKYAHVRLQSGEIRYVPANCCATIGKVSNPDWKLRSLGKAGRSRWLGRRPHVRGMAMNATDHPHGGGRGKSKGGKHPRSIWGWKTKGRRTRRPSDKDGNKMVIRERPRGKDKLASRK